MIQPQPHISALSPYALADLSAPDGKTLLSLSQNESLRPPSSKACAAAAKALDDARIYPDPDWTELRGAIAALHGFDAGQVLCGCGSLDLIAAIATVYAGPGHAVLVPRHAYPFFRTAALVSGARFDTAPEDDLTVSVDALLWAVRPETAIVFVANPGNPTGTRLERAELARLRGELPSDVLLVIDEAYGEFADHLDTRCWDIVESGNTVVLRTFSKAYGLAGMRIGWGLFPPRVATEVRKVLNPNAVTAASQAAAYAALEDQDYMLETCQITAAIRDETARKLRHVGFELLTSFTNFLLLSLPSEQAAERADAALRAEGMFLRRQQGAGLPHCLRMTIGHRDTMMCVVESLRRWKEEECA